MADNQDLLTPNHENCNVTQVIDEYGIFNDVGIENFMKDVESVNHGLPYGIVSIIGPQNSGKSTLLNCLFGTKFQEMDESLVLRSRTTKGVWIARSEEGNCPLTLVLDVEGTDGRQRAESQDNTFEKLSALFVLSVSNVVLINMWYTEIGRHNAANMPLFESIFEERKNVVTDRKITLLFTIRDVPKEILQREVAFDILKEQLLAAIRSIWESVDATTPLSENFNVEVVGLHHYKYEKGEFDNEVANLRQLLYSNYLSDGELAGDRNINEASFDSIQRNWEHVNEMKCREEPSREVSTDRCADITRQKYTTFAAKEKELCKKKSEDNGALQRLVNQLNSLIVVCLSEYDEETRGYDEGVRSKWRNLLQEDLLQIFKPTFISALEDTRSRALVEFKNSLDKVIKEEKKVLAAAKDCNIPAVLAAAAENCIMSCMSYFENEYRDVVFEQANKDKNLVKLKLASDIRKHIDVKNEHMLKKRKDHKTTMTVLKYVTGYVGSLCVGFTAGALIAVGAEPFTVIHVAGHICGIITKSMIDGDGDK